MNAKTFKILFRAHRDKLSEAWNRLTDRDLDWINGDLFRFVQAVTEVYQTPKDAILRELDAVKRNIDAKISADLAPHLDPEE